MKLSYLLLGLALVSSSAGAQQLTPDEQKLVEKYRAINSSLHPQYDSIRIPEANATLNLGKNYYFLPSNEAKNVLINAWNNPPEAVSNVLGVVFPSGAHFYDAHGWAAVITYEPVGYIPSSDSTQSDFDRAEKAIRDNEDAINERRKKAGAVPIHFVGWADPPQFNSSTHTVIWARDLHFGSASTDTLNYDVRVLGRRGFLSMNMVAGIPDLPQIRGAAGQLRQTAVFEPGSRYEEYQAGMDKKAAYGIAGLVAAGAGVALAQKLGIVGLIALFAKKGLVLIAAAFAALATRVRGLFAKKKDSR